MSIYQPIPNNPFYSPQSYNVSTPTGGLILGTGLSVTADGTLLASSAAGGTVTSVTAGTGLSGGVITTTGTINLVPATAATLGGIKVGANLTVAPDGTLNAAAPGTGTISSISTSSGLSGGGGGPVVNLSLNPATTSQLGGVVIGNGINVVGGLISLASATTTQLGGVQLATAAEVIAGTDPNKVVTPFTLASKVASTSQPGIVQLSDSVATADSTVAATQTAVFTANNNALAAQATASAALPLTGGTLTGPVTFAAGQTFPGVAFPVATTLSPGVVQVGSGLTVDLAGVLSTTNNGTVTGVTAGTGLGAPVTGNIITSSGTINLLPPTADGLTIGGVKAGSNISIDATGTISAGGFVSTNNPFAFDGYIWPLPDTFGFVDGQDGYVLSILDRTTGQIGWTNAGTLTSVVAGAGLTVTSTPTTATVSLTPTGITPATVGGTGLIPTFQVNAQGQITSYGLANPYAPFQIASISVPPNLVLDFDDNNTNWEWTLSSNIAIQTPLNSQSGQRGSLLLRQAPLGVYNVTWSTDWKFANGVVYSGPSLVNEVDLVEFVVVAGNYIVVTNVVSNLL